MIEANGVSAGVSAPDSTRPAGRIPSLDGLRAVSILMVLIAHVGATRGFPHVSAGVLEPLWRFTFTLGGLGVRVFFVISGFLITTLLIDEHARTGKISLVGFFTRRAIRILPALLVFLAGVYIAEQRGWATLLPGDWSHALTFTMNYHPQRAWSVGHLWSLSVEEQFYLLWPALVALVGMARSLKVAFAVVLLCPVIRVALFVLAPRYHESIDESFETVADSIATGCVLAGARGRLGVNPLYQRILRSRAMVLVPFVILLAFAQSGHPLVSMSVGETVVNVGIALVVDWSVRNPSTRVGRFFESRFCRFVGVRSYSLYLWQQIFMSRSPTSFTMTFPFNVAFSLLAAVISFGTVEQPLLRLRARLSHASRPPRPTAAAKRSSPR